MPDLSQLSKFTTAAGALSNLILVNPQSLQGYQPQVTPNKDGTLPAAPPNFLFHYESENIVMLQSDITDHYIEDNTAINDQIALAPEKIKVTGFIGELNDVVPEPVRFLKTAADKLTSVGAYEPELTITALNAYNAAFQAYYAVKAVADSAVATWGTLTGSNAPVQITGTESAEELAALSKNNKSQTKQQVAFQQFYGYWRKRTLFTVQTPWAIFNNMAIESLSAIQSEETDEISSFEIMFKIMRFANTIQTEKSAFDMQGRLLDQSSSVTDLGTSAPVSGESLLSVVG